MKENRKTYHCKTCFGFDEWNNCIICGRHNEQGKLIEYLYSNINWENIALDAKEWYGTDKLEDLTKEQLTYLGRLYDYSMPHTHTFEDQGATTDTGERIKNCTNPVCDTYQDASGEVIN